MVEINCISWIWFNAGNCQKLLSSIVFVFIITFYIDCMFLPCHYVLQTECTLFTSLNFKELLAWNRRDIWSLNDCSGTWTNNHLVRKRTLNHLPKLTRWLSCVVSTYLYVAFDCILQSLFILFIRVSYSKFYCLLVFPSLDFNYLVLQRYSP